MDDDDLIQTKTLKAAVGFEVTRESIEDLFEILEGFTGSNTTSLRITCTDGELSTSNLTHLLEHKNTRRSQIRALHFSARDAKLRRWIDVTLRSSLVLDGLEYDIRGKPEDVTIVAQKLDDWIESISVSYARLLPPDWLWFALSFTGVLWGFVLILYKIALLHDQQPGLPLKVFLNVLGVCTLIPLSFYYRESFTPKGSFAIGDGVKRSNAAGGRRAIVFGGIVLAVLANVFSSFLYDKLKG